MGTSPQNARTTPLNSGQIDAYLNQCVGKRVASVWNGSGSPLFLELGRLYRYVVSSGGTIGSRGDVTVMIQWSWRIDGPRSIVVGTFDSDRRIVSKPQILKGQRITDIFGQLSTSRVQHRLLGQQLAPFLRH